MKCQHRGPLVGIIAPQECNQAWDCVGKARGKEGGREGKRDGREEQNNPDFINSFSHCFLDSFTVTGLQYYQQGPPTCTAHCVPVPEKCWH